MLNTLVAPVVDLVLAADAEVVMVCVMIWSPTFMPEVISVKVSFESPAVTGTRFVAESMMPCAALVAITDVATGEAGSST